MSASASNTTSHNPYQPDYKPPTTSSKSNITPRGWRVIAAGGIIVGLTLSTLAGHIGYDKTHHHGVLQLNVRYRTSQDDQATQESDLLTLLNPTPQPGCTR